MGELVDVKLFHALHYSRIPAKIFRFGAGIESQGPTLHSPTLPPKIIRVVHLIVAYQIAIRSLNHKNGKIALFKP